MSREELVKNLREIARINSISMRRRDICAEAADVIEELSKGERHFLPTDKSGGFCGVDKEAKMAEKEVDGNEP